MAASAPILSLFWDLASVDDEKRVDAAGSGLDVAAAASALSTDATTVAPGARPA